jgi:hypothetical protein
MNKSILILAIFTGTFFTSCKSAAQKETAAKENVVEAKQDLKNTKENNANEWLVFKAEAKAKIAENDQKIAELKVKKNKPGKTFDGMYRNKIEKLSAKNAELKTRINNYDGNQTEWKTFQNDFNRDMKELGNNIKDLFS